MALLTANTEAACREMWRDDSKQRDRLEEKLQRAQARASRSNERYERLNQEVEDAEAKLEEYEAELPDEVVEKLRELRKAYVNSIQREVSQLLTELDELTEGFQPRGLECVQGWERLANRLPAMKTLRAQALARKKKNDLLVEEAQTALA